MDASIKSLVITGAAVEDAARSRRPIGSRKKRSTRQEDEELLEKIKDFSSQESSRPIIKVDTPVSQEPKVEVKLQARLEPKVELKVQPSLEKVEPKVEPKIEPKVELRPKLEVKPETKPEPVYDGTPKVILKPAKNPRVKLQPKGNQITSTANSIPNTRKARRFRLTVSSLNHRFTRAKRVKDDTEKKSMPSIREYLVQRGVIQEKSKAPEKMLRSMYRDFMLLKDTAL